MRKKLLLLFITAFFSFNCFAQTEPFALCDSVRMAKFPFQYWFNAKYPISSEMLAKQANLKLQTKAVSVSGFITYRFIVNCKGQTGNYEVYQVDSEYKNTSFNKNYVEALLQFVKGLNQWKKLIIKEKERDYYAYLTFKIENGIIKEIIP